MLRGRLLTESLRLDAELAVPDLAITRLFRQDVSASVVETQPDVWTILDFEAPDERADELAEALAGALRAEDGWYVDFTVGDDHVIVFADRVFRYRIGDNDARQRAIDHGRSVGTPEHQLDWGD